jgi:hypothetical protein
LSEDVACFPNIQDMFGSWILSNEESIHFIGGEMVSPAEGTFVVIITGVCG